MTYKSSQHFHNSLRSTLVQAIASPYIIVSVILLFVIVLYRDSLQILDDPRSYTNTSVTFNNDDPFDWNGLVQRARDDELTIYESWIQSQRSSITSYFEEWHSYTTRSINVSLSLAMDSETKQMDYVDMIKDLVQSLNNQVINELNNASSQLQNIEDSLTTTLTVGNTIDIESVDLNVDGIQQIFSEILSKLQADRDDELQQLYQSREDLFDSIESLFENSLNALKVYSVNASNASNDNYDGDITMDEIDVNFHNVTASTENNDDGDNMSSLNTTLIVLGVCVVVIYFMLLLFHHKHFQYSSRSRTDELMEICDKKSNWDFFISIYKLKDPFITITTDLTVQFIHCDWFKLYWIEEYIVMNLPFMLFTIVWICILLLTVSNTKNTSMSSYPSLVQYEYEITIPGIEYEPLSMSSIESCYGFVNELGNDLESGLSSLFEEYNIQILGLQPIAWSNISIHSESLPSWSVDDTTMDLNVVVEDTQSTHESITLRFKNVVTNTFQLVLIVFGSISLAIVVFGVVYSFIV